MQFDEARIAAIVSEVIKNLRQGGGGPAAGSNQGVFADVESAMQAVVAAQKEFVRLDLARRGEIIAAIREAAIAHAEEFARMAREETRMGRVEDKRVKNINAAKLTPGLEDLPQVTFRTRYGVSLVQGSPFGVIVSILPTTHPTAIVINHAIAMLAAGNGIFFCPHPRGYQSSLKAMQVLNQAIVAAGGPANLMVCLEKGSLETVNQACAHEATKMIVATGGPAVVKAALASGKKAIAAGPGNPPVLVDETADLDKAARDIVAGATFDNNILCIAEKTIIAVETIADELIRAFLRTGQVYRLQGSEIERMTELVTRDGHVVGEWVGQDAAVILSQIGIKVPDTVRMAIMEVGPEHPLVGIEQMLPVLPLVRVPDFAAGVQLAVTSEHGFRHTAIIHSRDITRITAYARAMQATITVANSPSGAALAVDGEGQYTHTLAGPTGEGVCTPKTFMRETRLTIGGALHYL